MSADKPKLIPPQFHPMFYGGGTGWVVEPRQFEHGLPWRNIPNFRSWIQGDCAVPFDSLFGRTWPEPIVARLDVVRPGSKSRLSWEYYLATSGLTLQAHGPYKDVLQHKLTEQDIPKYFTAS